MHLRCISRPYPVTSPRVAGHRPRGLLRRRPNRTRRIPLNAVGRSVKLRPMAPRTRLLRDDDLRALLARKGLRVTGQRLTLLRELARLRLPVSHAELTDRLATSGLDRATVYRNLLSLTKAGLLVRTQLGDNVWRFELPRGAAGEHGNHAHFVCTDCGDVACLPEGSVVLRSLANRARVAEVQLRGQCGACVRP